MLNSFQLLTIFTKSSILDVWQGSEYPSVIDNEDNNTKGKMMLVDFDDFEGKFKSNLNQIN